MPGHMRQCKGKSLLTLVRTGADFWTDHLFRWQNAGTKKLERQNNLEELGFELGKRGSRITTEAMPQCVLLRGYDG